MTQKDTLKSLCLVLFRAAESAPDVRLSASKEENWIFYQVGAYTNALGSFADACAVPMGGIVERIKYTAGPCKSTAAALSALQHEIGKSSTMGKESEAT